MIVTVSVVVEVRDSLELYKHAAGSGRELSDIEHLRDGGRIDVGACLRELIDPGAIGGCKVLYSSAETDPD